MGKKTLRLLKIAANPWAYFLALRDIVGIRCSVLDDADHLDAAIDWILRAQRATTNGGVSAYYCLGYGWCPAYPETTGYIIPTCLDYATLRNRADVRDAALRMGAWTLGRQTPCGGVRGSVYPDAPPIVFNTGQCMQGWLRLVDETAETRYLEAIEKAASWLISIQDADGKWSRHEYRNEPHAYHTLVAWPLFQAAQRLGRGDFRTAALRNLEWCLAQVEERAWIRHMAFAAGEPVLTHTLAYTYHGLLECAAYLDDADRMRTLRVVMSAAEELLHLYESRKSTPYGLPRFMPATVSPQWRATATYSCLTGNAQIAMIWFRVFRTCGDGRYVNAARKMLDDVKQCQNLKCSNPGIRGGIPSSHPIYGGYLPMRYLNWAAKFFADALMLSISVRSRGEEKVS